MNMDMLEIHAAAMKSSITLYHEFLQYYKPNEPIVYGFVEGKDDPSFYRGLIENNLPDGWKMRLIISGSKDKVLEVFDDMDWSRFPKKCICFFVDRDLSEFLGGIQSRENIYVTDNYSIENEIVTFDIMERYLEEILGVTGLRPTETDKIKDLFESNLKTFSEAMTPVMAQIILWRQKGEGVLLDKIVPKDFFVFQDGKIELAQSFISSRDRIQYAASCVSAERAMDDEIIAALDEFQSKEGPKKYIRGKYLIWFFVQCGKEIHQAIPNLCPRYTVRPKNRIGLGITNAIVVIANWVRCPSSLKLFLDANFVSYITEVTAAR